MKPYETSVFISHRFDKESMLNELMIDKVPTILMKRKSLQYSKLNLVLNNSTCDVIALSSNRPRALGLMLARMGYHVFIRRPFNSKDFPTEPGSGMSSYDYNFIKLVMVGMAGDEKLSLSAKGIFGDPNVMSKYHLFSERKVGRAQYRYIKKATELDSAKTKEAV